MPVPWSLSVTAADRIETTIGNAVDDDAAVTAVLIAALDAIDAAARTATPAAHYELRAGGELVALIQTGADDSGLPDYATTRALIQRIEEQRGISAVPY